MTTVVSSGLLPLEAPLPVERTDDLLAVAEVIEGDDPRWLGGTWTEGWPPGPAFTHDPCSTGSDREKVAAGDIPTQVSGRFVVYLPATCRAQFIGASIDRFRARLERAFKVYERAAVERVLVSGDGHDSLGGFLGDGNMDVLSDDSVDPVTAMRLLETELALRGGGIIHAAPSTVVAWDALNLTVVRGALTYTKRGTPIAVGAGYINALPLGMSELGDGEQWAFASGPIQIIRGAIEFPGNTYAQVFDRTSNDVEVIAERPYVFNWIGRQDVYDEDHTQAGVLVDESGVSGSAFATAPTAPTLTAAEAGDGEVTLAWTAPSSTGGSPITAYKVYRGTSSGSETLLATTGVTLTYVDDTVVNGTEYFYKVTAVNAVGESAQSNELSATPAGTIAFDDFNRANGALGANWSGPIENVANAQPLIDTNVVKRTSSPTQNDAYWNADSFGADQYAKFTVVTVDPSTAAVFLRLCITSITVGAPTSYVANVVFTGSGSTVTFELYRGVAGSYTLLGSNSGTLVNNDVVEARVVGTSLQMLKNGAVVLSVTDGSPLGAGYVGFGISSSVARIDNFEAGNL